MRPKGLRAGQRFLSEGQQALFPPAIGGLGESCVLPPVGSNHLGAEGQPQMHVGGVLGEFFQL